MKNNYIILCCLASNILQAADIFVTNTNSSGPGSLANAISTANNGDTIKFNIPGTGPFIITPATDLPDITTQVTIDGYSQAGSAVATPVSPAVIAIEIQAPNSSIAGLHFALGSAGSLIRGIALNSCTFTPAILVDDNNITITGNYIGMDASGTVSLPNLAGIIVSGATTRIGGLPAAQRNVIVGVNQSLNANPSIIGTGALITLFSDNNIIEGNYLGTNPTGTAVLGVSEVGVYVFSGTLNQILSNVISGNTMAGIVLGTGGRGAQQILSNTVIEKNIIGLDSHGVGQIPNGFGISIIKNCDNTVINENIISGNLYSGIQIGTFFINSFNNNPAVQGPTFITNNLIGTESNGKLKAGNGTFGIVLNEGTSGTTVGGVMADAGNILADSGIDGISISSYATNNLIQGNYIGTNKYNAILGNKRAGVAIGGLAKPSSNNVVGI